MAATKYVGAEPWVPDKPSLSALRAAVLRTKDRQPAYDALVADLRVAAGLL